MANLKENIPDHIWDEIVDSIRRNCRERIYDSWKSSSSDEDSITGDFWGGIRKTVGNPFKPKPQGWDWDIEYLYKKIRGKGKNAPETFTGSDGIFEINIYNEFGKLIFNKAILFQAKKKNNFYRSTTEGQAERMDELAPGGSIIIVHSEDGYYAVKSEEYLESDDYEEYDICEYIIGIFMECEHGRFDMSFDNKEEVLTIKDDDGVVNKYSPYDLEESVKLSIKKKRK